MNLLVNFTYIVKCKVLIERQIRNLTDINFVTQFLRFSFIFEPIVGLVFVGCPYQIGINVSCVPINNALHSPL